MCYHQYQQQINIYLFFNSLTTLGCATAYLLVLLKFHFASSCPVGWGSVQSVSSPYLMMTIIIQSDNELTIVTHVPLLLITRHYLARKCQGSDEITWPRGNETLFVHSQTNKRPTRRSFNVLVHTLFSFWADMRMADRYTFTQNNETWY